jgi:hypothetical protein
MRNEKAFGAKASFSVLLIALGAALSAQSFDFTPIRPEIVSARLAGYGGPFTTLEAGIDTLSTNPAALAFTKPEWSFSRIAINVSGPLFDLPSVFQSSDIPSAVLDLVAANNGLYVGSELTGPLAIAKVDKNFGFGVFNRIIANANIPSISKATIYGGLEFSLVGGYGMTVVESGPHSLSLGIQVKGFVQTLYDQSGNSLPVLTNFSKMDTSSIPVVLSTGFGLDAGVLYKVADFSVGLTCRDAFTPVFTTHYANAAAFGTGVPDSSVLFDTIDPELSAGVAYSIPFPEDWVALSSLKVMLDYRDIIPLFKPLHRNPLLNVSLGTEIVVVKIVSLRAGINETYLTAGAGLDLTIFKLDFAMYGSELGLEPGKRPCLNMALGLSFEY